MSKLKDDGLFRTIRNYLKVYLPEQRNCSRHTVTSYKTALNQYLDYITDIKKIPLREVTFDCFNVGNVSAFLDYIETNQEVSAKTRNQRLQALKAFLKYSSALDSATAALFMDIQKIPLKKLPEKNRIEFLSEKAIAAILAVPDASKERDFRNLAIMILMYDTGARVQEITNLKVKDLRLTDSTPVVNLFGKGRKHRTVPLMENTFLQMKKYLSIFHPEEDEYSEEPLFYVVRHQLRSAISTDSIRIFLQKYASIAKNSCKDIPDSIHPHMIRHSRAMHLYRHGMDLMLISQWLGHSNISTTLIYAHADTEMKRSAIEKATREISLPDCYPDKYDINDEAILKKLYGLKD